MTGAGAGGFVAGLGLLCGCGVNRPSSEKAAGGMERYASANWVSTVRLRKFLFLGGIVDVVSVVQLIKCWSWVESSEID
jgi:hypothetical protein